MSVYPTTNSYLHVIDACMIGSNGSLLKYTRDWSGLGLVPDSQFQVPTFRAMSEYSCRLYCTEVTSPWSRSSPLCMTTSIIHYFLPQHNRQLSREKTPVNDDCLWMQKEGGREVEERKRWKERSKRMREWEKAKQEMKTTLLCISDYRDSYSHTVGYS